MGRQWHRLPAGHIRLLQLQPDTGSTSISFKAVRAPLSESTYECVSYVWGTELPSDTIYVDGSPVKVRENLFQFFLTRRQSSQQCLLWVDALCINQSDLIERGQQVSLMGLIYQNARRVLIWLGPSDAESDLAMEFISRAKLSHPLTHKEDTIRKGLLALIQRQYWYRTWVVQEFCLGSDLRLMCGKKQVDWISVNSFCSKIDESTIRAKNQDWTFFQDSQAYRLFKQRETTSKGDAVLCQLLIDNRNTECLEPKDRVYSMLSLANDYKEGYRTIEVSYLKDNAKLFCDVLNFCRLPASDVFRFGHFLRRLLRINTFAFTLPPAPSDSQEILQVDAFRTGKIVYNNIHRAFDNLNYSHAEGVPTVVKGYGLLDPSSGMARFQSDDFEAMKQEIMTMDVRRLHAPFHSLRDISIRSFGNTAGSTSTTPEVPRFSLVIVWFGGHKVPSSMLGLTYGAVNKGDIVVQLPGYDTAFTMTSPRLSSAMHPPRLTGRVLCIGREGFQKDKLTDDELQFHAIQSGNNVDASTNITSLMLTPEELLTLLR